MTGWKEYNLSDLASYVTGKLNSNASVISGDYPFFTCSPDTLLARITPCLENGKSAYVTFLENGQVGWGSTEFIVMRSKGDLHSLFTYALVKNRDFRDYAEGCLEGSSGRQRVNIDHLAKYEIFIPEESIISEYNKIMQNIEPKLHSNFLQIRTLEKLRDTLLPKLMSGEVRMEMDSHAEPHEIRRNHA
jgi:type I restriction enzyme S subunit